MELSFPAAVLGLKRTALAGWMLVALGVLPLPITIIGRSGPVASLTAASVVPLELAAGLNELGDETPWTSSADHGDSFERIRYFDEGRLHGIARCVPGMKFGGWNGALVYRSGVEVSVSPLGYENVEGPLPSTATPTPAGTKAPGPGSTVRVAAVFEITVKNGSAAAFDATGMGSLIVRYGERGLLAETVPAAATSTPDAGLGILQPGQTKKIKVSAVIPAGQLTVRVAVPGPNPEVDWAASFEGELPPR